MKYLLSMLMLCFVVSCASHKHSEACKDGNCTVKKECEKKECKDCKDCKDCDKCKEGASCSVEKKGDAKEEKKAEGKASKKSKKKK